MLVGEGVGHTDQAVSEVVGLDWTRGGGAHLLADHHQVLEFARGEFVGRGAEPFEVKAGTFVGSERLLDLVGKQVGVDGGRELSLVLDFDAASRDIDAVTRYASPERSLTARLSGSPGPRVPLRCRPSQCSNGSRAITWESSRSVLACLL